MNNDGIRALIIADCLAEAEEWQSISSKSECKDRIRPIYPSAIKKEKASLQSLLTNCQSTYEDEGDIDAILTVNKDHALVQSILVKKLNLQTQQTPSFESLIVCMHKYYTKHRLLRDFNLAFDTIEVDDAGFGEYKNALDETGEPALLVDAVSSQGSLYKKITLEQMSLKEIESVKKSVTKNFEKFKDFFEEHTQFGKDNYPCIFEPMCIVNEYWKNFDKDVTFHHAECCVSTITEEQELVPWALTDLVYCSGKRRSLMYAAIPSTIPSDTNVWAVLHEVYESLLKFGFKNYFFNAIVIASSNGDVKVVDVNAGIIKENTDLYRHVLLQGDNVKAFVDTGLGKMQRTPKVWPNRYAMRAELKTFIDDATNTVEDVIDLKTAKSIPNVELHVHSNDQDIVHDQDEGGMHLATVYLLGTNKEECLETFGNICDSILRVKTKMNWNFDMLNVDQLTQQKYIKSFS